jgi:hypothetical protein
MDRRGNEARVQWHRTKVGFTDVYVQITTVARNVYKYVFSTASGLSAVRKRVDYEAPHLLGHNVV